MKCKNCGHVLTIIDVKDKEITYRHKRSNHSFYCPCKKPEPGYKKVTIIANIYYKLMDCCFSFSDGFSSADVISVFCEKYPQDWNTIEKRFGKGGKKSGRQYTSNVYIGQMLKHLSEKKRIRFEGFKKNAPEWWGNPSIAHYTVLEVQPTDF
jgi:hypothetical protein